MTTRKSGEVASRDDGDRPSNAEDLKPTVSDIGLTHKEIHEARIIRDAEESDPGIVRRTLDKAGAPKQNPGQFRPIVCTQTLQ